MAKYTSIKPINSDSISILDTSARAHIKMTSLYLKGRFGEPTLKYKATEKVDSALEWVFVDKDNKPFTVYVIKGQASIGALEKAKDMEVQDFIFWVSNKK